MLGNGLRSRFSDYTQVPFFNQDMEFLCSRCRWRRSGRQSPGRMGVWLFVPEYNHSLPGGSEKPAGLALPSQSAWGSNLPLWQTSHLFRGWRSCGYRLRPGPFDDALSRPGMKMMAVPRTGIPLSPEAFKSNCLSPHREPGRTPAQTGGGISHLLRLTNLPICIYRWGDSFPIAFRRPYPRWRPVWLAIDPAALVVKPGTMAGTIPAFSSGIPLQLASKMRAAGGHQEDLPCLIPVSTHLLFPHSTMPPWPGCKSLSRASRGGSRSWLPRPLTAWRPFSKRF